MTAVEWLGIELNMFFTDITEEQWNRADKLFEQAKEMEKQQLYNFYVQGGIDCVTQADRTVEDFYNETFKSE